MRLRIVVGDRVNSSALVSLALVSVVLANVAFGSSGCGGSSSTDDTSRSQGDREQVTDQDAGVDEVSANQTSDRSDADQQTSAADDVPVPAEEIDDTCSRLCAAWEDCPEAGGQDCMSECRESSERAVSVDCRLEMLALYDCVLLTGVCPAQATQCTSETETLDACVDASVTQARGGATSGAASGSSGGSSSGANGGEAEPSEDTGAEAGGDPTPDPSHVPDPAEDFGGQQSTPQAIVDAAEIAQCSEFDVVEFGCGSTGVSFGGPLCTVECHDDDDVVWSALCRDGLCRCQYDGITYCQCSHEGASDEGCNSCCPELTDADLRFD